VLANPSMLSLGGCAASASRVSGTPSQNTRNARTAQAARNRNAAEYPKLSAMKPATCSTDQDRGAGGEPGGGGGGGATTDGGAAANAGG
jgi:hypothetical protein